jgi:hypothetical protein
MKVKVDSHALAEFVYECVDEVLKAKIKHLDDLPGGFCKSTLNCFYAGFLEDLRDDLHRTKRRFLRVTRKNIKANFRKGKKQ